MQRKAVRRALPGIAMLTALLAGCTGGGGGGTTSDAKAGGSPAAPAQPGKYSSLPAPCKAADGKRLRAMLPAPAALVGEQLERLYAGTADASYDGDRRVGCRWTTQTPEETRLLSVAFERVVSYDRAVASDDDKARQVYVRQLTDARLPFPGPATPPGAGTGAGTSAGTGGSPSPHASPSGGAAPDAAAGAPAPGAPASPGATSAPPELGSRVLEGLGNEAFLDDKLSAAGATAAQARTVRIVFRTSNVIVTVEYSVQPSLPGTVPPSTETQDEARQLAQALAERFND